MTVVLLISLLVVGATIILHGVGLTVWLRFLLRRFRIHDLRASNMSRLWMLIATAVVLIALHFIEILLWAVTYLLVAPGELPSLETAVYFSAVTFTTLGYGDITLTEWRLMSGIEAIDGILLVGWSTAFMFSVLQRAWGVMLADMNPQEGKS